MAPYVAHAIPGGAEHETGSLPPGSAATDNRRARGTAVRLINQPKGREWVEIFIRAKS